jgi:hypothetical protein
MPRVEQRLCTLPLVTAQVRVPDGDGIYRNSPVAAAFLAGPGPGDLRPFSASMP